MNGQFGWSVAVVDMNADGHHDLAVGSPSADAALLQYHGAVYVYLGQSDDEDQPALSPQPNIIIQCTVLYCTNLAAFSTRPWLQQWRTYCQIKSQTFSESEGVNTI